MQSSSLDPKSAYNQANGKPPKMVIFLLAIFLFLGIFSLLGEIGIIPYKNLEDAIAQVRDKKAPNLQEIAEKLQGTPPITEDSLDRCQVIDPNVLPTINTVGDLSIEARTDPKSENFAGINEEPVISKANLPKLKEIIGLASDQNAGNNGKMSFVVAVVNQNSSDNILATSEFINTANAKDIMPVIQLCNDADSCGFRFTSGSQSENISLFFKSVDKLVSSNGRYIVALGPKNPAKNMTKFGISSGNYASIVKQTNAVASSLNDLRATFNNGKMLLAPAIFELDDSTGSQDFSKYVSNGLQSKFFDFMLITASDKNGGDIYKLFNSTGDPSKTNDSATTIRGYARTNKLKVLVTSLSTYSNNFAGLKSSYEAFCDDATIKGMIFYDSISGRSNSKISPQPSKTSISEIRDIASKCEVNKYDDLDDYAWVSCNVDTCLYEDTYEPRTVARACGVDKTERKAEDLLPENGAALKVTCDGQSCKTQKFDTLEVHAPIKQFGSNSVIGTRGNSFISACAEAISYFNQTKQAKDENGNYVTNSYDPLNQFAGEIKVGNISYPMPWLGNGINCAANLLPSLFVENPEKFFPDYDIKNYSEGSLAEESAKEQKAETITFPRLGTKDEEIIDERAIKIDLGEDRTGYLDVSRDFLSLKSSNIRPYDPTASSSEYKTARQCSGSELIYRDDSTNYVIGPEFQVTPTETVWSGTPSQACQVYAQRNTGADNTLFSGQAKIINKQVLADDNVLCTIAKEKPFTTITLPVYIDTTTGDLLVQQSSGLPYYNPLNPNSARAYAPTFPYKYHDPLTSTELDPNRGNYRGDLKTVDYPISVEERYYFDTAGNINVDPWTKYKIVINGGTVVPMNYDFNKVSRTILDDTPSIQASRNDTNMVGAKYQCELGQPNVVTFSDTLGVEDRNVSCSNSDSRYIFTDKTKNITCGQAIDAFNGKDPFFNNLKKYQQVDPRVNQIFENLKNEFKCQNTGETLLPFETVGLKLIQGGNCVYSDQVAQCIEYFQRSTADGAAKCQDLKSTNSEIDCQAEDNLYFKHNKYYDKVGKLEIPGIYDALYAQYMRLQYNLSQRHLKIVFKENVGMKVDVKVKMRDAGRNLSQEVESQTGVDPDLGDYGYYADTSGGSSCKMPDEKYLFDNNTPLARGKYELTESHYFDWLGYLDVLQELNVAYVNSTLPDVEKIPNPYYPDADQDDFAISVPVSSSSRKLQAMQELLVSNLASQLTSFPIRTCDEYERLKAGGDLPSDLRLLGDNFGATCITYENDSRYIDDLAYFLCQQGYDLGIQCDMLCTAGNAPSQDGTAIDDSPSSADNPITVEPKGNYDNVTCPLPTANTCYQGPEGSFTHCALPDQLPLDLYPNFNGSEDPRKRDMRIVAPESGTISEVTLDSDSQGNRGYFVTIKGEITGVVYRIGHLKVRTGYKVGVKVKAGEVFADICGQYNGSCVYDNNNVHSHVWAAYNGKQIDPYFIYGKVLGCNAKDPGNLKEGAQVPANGGYCYDADEGLFDNGCETPKTVARIGDTEAQEIIDKLEKGVSGGSDNDVCNGGTKGPCTSSGVCQTGFTATVDPSCPQHPLQQRCCAPKKDTDPVNVCDGGDKGTCSVSGSCSETEKGINDNTCPQSGVRCCKVLTAEDQNELQDQLPEQPAWCEDSSFGGDQVDDEEIPDTPPTTPGNAGKDVCGDAPGDPILGIDISHWNYKFKKIEDIDWSVAKSQGNVQFAFIKATEGVTLVDDKFVEGIARAKAAGVFVGAYHFARPAQNSARAEAEFFCSQVKQYTVSGYMRPALDIEGEASTLSTEALSKWISDFMTTFSSCSGVEPILYTNSNFINNHLSSEVDKYDLWIAQYGGDEPSIKRPWAFWQYTSSGTIAGIKDPTLDLNAFYGSAQCMKDNYGI